ncbi:hypothetical protein PIROE2DRAFT_2467, partial [Piromyces sp. E2]
MFNILSFNCSFFNRTIGKPYLIIYNKNCRTNDIYSQYGIIVNDKKNAYIEIEVTKPEATGYNITMIAIV